MTVEELITKLARSVEVWEPVDYEVAVQIEKVLKAGQAMRMATNIKDTRKAYAAWDEVTKETT